MKYLIVFMLASIPAQADNGLKDRIKTNIVSGCMSGWGMAYHELSKKMDQKTFDKMMSSCKQLANDMVR